MLPALAFLGLLSAPASATPVLVNGTLATYTHDNRYGDGNQSVAQGLGTGSLTTSSIPTATATAGAVNTLSGNTLTLAQTFSQHIGAPAPDPFSYYDYWYGQVNGYRGDIYAESLGGGTFTLEAGDVGYTYSMDALITQTGTSQVYLYASLTDMTTYQQLYYTHRVANTPGTDVSLTLSSGGNYLELSGAASGDLIAGHTYNLTDYTMIRHWNYGNGTWTNAYGETAADAQGFFNLTVQGPQPAVAAVPEPSTWVLAGLGFALLAAFSRRRRAA